MYFTGANITIYPHTHAVDRHVLVHKWYYIFYVLRKFCSIWSEFKSEYLGFFLLYAKSNSNEMNIKMTVTCNWLWVWKLSNVNEQKKNKTGKNPNNIRQCFEYKYIAQYFYMNFIIYKLEYFRWIPDVSGLPSLDQMTCIIFSCIVRLYNYADQRNHGIYYSSYYFVFCLKPTAIIFYNEQATTLR